jgi:hypothetical protein
MTILDAAMIGIVAVLVTVKFSLLAVATFLFITDKPLHTVQRRGAPRPSPQRHPGPDAHA